MKFHFKTQQGHRHWTNAESVEVVGKTRESTQKEAPQFAEPPLPLHGDADRYNHRDGNDDYTQTGNLFRLFDHAQKQRLFDNLAPAMQGVSEHIQRRQVAHFAKCDPAYGAGVALALKLDTAGDDRLKGTSATDEPRETTAV